MTKGGSGGIINKLTAREAVHRRRVKRFEKLFERNSEKGIDKSDLM